MDHSSSGNNLLQKLCLNTSARSDQIRIDLHIHSKYSHDGVLDPAEIIRIAREKGLGGIAITDHNTIRGGQEAKQFETEVFRVIVGMEIMTDQGEITGLFLSQEIKARNITGAISEIKDQGGIVIVPHPFDRLRRSAFHINERYANMVDAIEGFNSRCIFQAFNRKAIEFAAQYNLPIVAGSDAHYANEIGLAGINIQSEDIKLAIMQSELQLFGKRSSLLNHARTKIHKLRAKATK